MKTLVTKKLERLNVRLDRINSDIVDCQKNMSNQIISRMERGGLDEVDFIRFKNELTDLFEMKARIKLVITEFTILIDEANEL